MDGVALTILGAYCTECLRPVNLPKPLCCFGDREDCYAAYWEGERITGPAILVVKKAGRPATERELSASAHREIIQHPLPDIDVRDQKSGADRVDKTTIINGTPMEMDRGKAPPTGSSFTGLDRLRPMRKMPRLLKRNSLRPSR